MQIFSYFLLFLTVRITIQQEYQYGKCAYLYEPLTAICDNQTEGNAFPNDIFSNITVLKVYSKEASNRWLLTQSNTFTRFYNLNKLIINGHFSLSNHLVDIIDKLSTEFFDIATLRHFQITDFSFWGDSGEITITWKPPPKLETVVLISTPIERFDWKNVTTLKTLQVENINFPNLSEIANPSSVSLEKLYVKEIGHSFKIYDIAFLCHLSVFSFDGNLLSSSDQYCECERYKKWQEFLWNDETVNLTYAEKPLICSTEKTNCSSYTLDEAKENRTKCLNLPDPENADSGEKLSFWTRLWNLLITIAEYGFITLAILVFVFILTILALGLRNGVSLTLPLQFQSWAHRSNEAQGGLPT